MTQKLRESDEASVEPLEPEESLEGVEALLVNEALELDSKRLERKKKRDYVVWMTVLVDTDNQKGRWVKYEH